MPENIVKAAYGRAKWSLILRGILGIAVGVYILARPLRSIAAFALVIAIWALFDGAANIARAIALRKVVRHWGAFLVLGIIGVAFGVAALYYFPALSLAFAVTWMALWLIVGGATVIYIATQERKLGMNWGWTMALGVLAVIAGIVDYTFPGITLVTLMGLISGFAIISGVGMLIAAARLSSAKHRVEELGRDVRETETEREREERDRIDRGGTPGSRAA